MDDEMLARAAEKAAAILDNSLPRECTHSFSAAFQRKMNRILRRQRHPALYRCLRSAAVFLLVLTACFGSLLALSAEAREFVFGWVRERYDAFYYYYFTEERAAADSPQFCPGWLPEGFALDSIEKLPGGEIYCYRDEDGWLATFSYLVKTDAVEMYIQCADFEQREVSINGLPGTLYLSPDDSDSSEIVWIDSEKGILFNLGAHVSEDILIKMAESVVSKK